MSQSIRNPHFVELLGKQMKVGILILFHFKTFLQDAILTDPSSRNISNWQILGDHLDNHNEVNKLVIGDFDQDVRGQTTISMERDPEKEKEEEEEKILSLIRELFQEDS